MTESLQIFVADDPRREPKLRSVGPDGRDVCVGALVHASHETTIEQALETVSPGLARESLDQILTYCAERRCDDDNASCPGCHKRQQEDGIRTVDDFVARHHEISTVDQRVLIKGRGQENLVIETVDDLPRLARGTEYWYWARRVLRKLRHGLRGAHQTGAPAPDAPEAPSIVLAAPQLADNIGMSARAMGNFGLTDLRLVAPRDGWPNEQARVSAAGANGIIDDAKCYDRMADALRDTHWVCATTARQRNLRKPIMSPAKAAAEMTRRIGEGQKCAMLFGRESSGLSSDELAAADALVMIPVNSRFASLNLAQAVLLLGYAWIMEQPENARELGRVTALEKSVTQGLKLGRDRQATKQELQGFLDQLETALFEKGFFRPIERRQALVRNLTAMFTRMEASDQEIRTLRGIVATLVRNRRDND